MSLVQQEDVWVPVDEIDAELARQWITVHEGIEKQTGHPPMRTSILNLVIVVTGPYEARYARDSLLQVAHVMPSRVILIEVQPAGEEIRAQVWAHCLLETNRRGHCYDVIEIRVSEKQLSAVPNIIARNKLTDLPTFLFWAGQTDIGSDAFARISASANRIIIDSKRFDDALAALNEFAAYLENQGPDCAASDLVWTRLTGWRELIAQSFDGAVPCALLPSLRRIDIAYDPRAEADALLIAGWFTSRLGWMPATATRSRSTHGFSLAATDQKGRSIQIGLEVVPSSGVGLRAVRIFSQNGGRSTRVAVRRLAANHAVATIDATGMPHQERLVPHSDLSTRDLVSRELLSFEPDWVYREALAHAALFAGLLPKGVDG
jgi:glucose-6-phosphate dehydrogenase assembly protein OpcA